jgi:hypothetical protein
MRQHFLIGPESVMLIGNRFHDSPNIFLLIPPREPRTTVTGRWLLSHPVIHGSVTSGRPIGLPLGDQTGDGRYEVGIYTTDYLYMSEAMTEIAIQVRMACCSD